MTNDPKARIKQAATQLLIADRFEAITLKQICRVADLGNGSYYNVFDTKEELAGELYADGCRRRDEVVAAALAECPGDGEGAIKTVLRQLIAFVASSEPSAVYLRRLKDATAGETRFKADRDGMAGLVGMLEAWLKQPMIATQVAPVPAVTVAILLLAPAAAFAQLLLADPTAATAEAVEHLSERIWRALQAEPVAKPRGVIGRASQRQKVVERDLFSVEKPEI